ncbi:GNAT family acetyltransferase [Acinetobacter sp. NCu2D-2]|uniref:GNAT family N-acetyltransferase n=1 Tax=Acinetobacter sp. NCu2D-2 TaxID=1608473 RepID=UPI0007CDBB9A|nr:GNAT family N-acetyltransferase [Acinetobacter sp. NCu2D-2]ANF82425.1 GNAT family acetyltransferase [Acinetobacter sp. NCu2D-2]
MLMTAEFFIRSGTWQVLMKDAKAIREAVFIQEQNIQPEDEWDEMDAVSEHFVVYVGEQPVATARLLLDHHIGRVAVLRDYRGLHIGQQLMQFIIDFAKQEYRPFLQLSSQVHALGFYEGLGFQVQGQEYLDCGIPHIDMYLQMTKTD